MTIDTRYKIPYLVMHLMHSVGFFFGEGMAYKVTVTKGEVVSVEKIIP